MADCTNTTVGLTPLTELAGTYQTFSGFLYPGSNDPPAGHTAEGVLAGQAVERRDADGNVSPAGKIAFVAAGMSNTRQEFERFRQIDDPIKAGYVYSINAAQVAQDATVMAGSGYWDVVDTLLANNSLTPAQVGWIWIKSAVAAESDAFPAHAIELQGYLKATVLIIAARYPNCKGISFSSRTYGGYASISTSPEPWAYEGAFAVKWLIESQIDGSDTDLDYTSVPWLGWGPYLWADGLTPRADGLIYECADFESDGTHPGPGAEDKVANMLLDYLETGFNTGWFSGQEAIQQATHTSLNSTTDGIAFLTASYTPTADALQVVLIHTRAGETPNVPTLSGHSLTYSNVTSRIFGTEASPNSRLSAFVASGASPTAGELTITFGGQTQTMCQASIMEFIGAESVAQFEEDSADAVNGITVTLPAVASTAGTAVVAGFANVGGTAYNPDEGWTEVHDIQVSTPLCRLESQYNLSFDQAVTGNLSSGATQNMAGIIMELQPASDPGGPDEDEIPTPGRTGIIIVGRP